MFYTTQNTTFISTGLLCPEAISIVANPTPCYNIHVTHVIVSYIHKMYNPALHNTGVVSLLLFSFVLFFFFGWWQNPSLIVSVKYFGKFANWKSGAEIFTESPYRMRRHRVVIYMYSYNMYIIGSYSMWITHISICRYIIVVRQTSI